MNDNTGRRRSTWLRATASAAAAAALLAGCGSGDGKAAEPSPSASAGSAAPTASGSPSPTASASSAGGSAATPTPFAADPAKVPRTARQAEALVQKVTLQPPAWGPDFRARQPAASAPGTVAVLDAQCRWQRRPLPKTVLASLSRYSELPGAGGKGTVKVTAAVTVHATVRDADQQLATTLEEPLRCQVQQVRTDEQISGLGSAASPFGQSGNTYSDDQVVEVGSYLTGTTAQAYRWYVWRLSTVTMAVSVMGATGYKPDELEQLALPGLLKMLNGVKSELGGEN
ncbi:hypothetical protein ACWGH3_30040 [Streptomyces sp. NPDC054884]|uniref:hypothetical protein n=1 Tax=Streptomyces sp. ME08-AFT2 TaxID=3028683 RepID=UPI0029B37677|nr:hypothetical protein [Streptomyces sp. ME08-AFT2]MDX3312248.1 hypothetical protein [Streptomyces sp. ME08-AFT2]